MPTYPETGRVRKTVRSRKFVLGAGLLGLLGVVVAVFAVLDHWAVVAIALAVMLGLNGVITLDASVRSTRLIGGLDRRVAQVTTLVEKRAAQIDSHIDGSRNALATHVDRDVRAAIEEAVSEHNPATVSALMDTIRLMQAQYVDRIDHAQSALDEAATLLREVHDRDEDGAHALQPGGDSVAGR